MPLPAGQETEFIAAMDKSSETGTGMKHIDLYDTPIDLRPVPKPDPIAACIEHLRKHGDYYGVQLLTRMKADVEDTENPKCPR